jgi:hypothetical protein
MGTGPRQTPSLDGSWSHGPGPQKQRVFNWTGVLDEVHDFERTVRVGEGGHGALTIPDPMIAGAMCGNLAMENPQVIGAIGGLEQPLRELYATPGNCTQLWDDVEAFVMTIRPPRPARGLDAAAIARGADVFVTQGACNACHGGPGFTVSRRFWTPTTADNAALAMAAFALPGGVPAAWNNHTLQIQAQRPQSGITTSGIGPPQVACVIRDVDTYGVPGDATATAALEIKDLSPPSAAQGAGGYNVPSLYGLALSAPYLHHGQALTLDALFDDPRWATHANAGNAGFLAALTPDSQADLVAYLLSIDGTTVEQGVPAPYDLCPVSFP